MGLSVQDLFSRTRINPDFIIALEAGDYHVLPEAYIRMFLRKVAQEVGADPDEIIIAYDRGALRQVREATPPASRESGSRWVIAAASSVILVGIVGLALLNQEASDPSANRLNPTESPIQIAETANDPSPTGNLPVVLPAPTPSADGAPNRASTPSSRSPAPATTVPPPNAVLAVPDETENPDSPQPADSESALEIDDSIPTARERVVAAYSLTPQSYGLTEAPSIALSAIGLGTSNVTVHADGETRFSGAIGSGRRLSWEANDRFLVEVDRGQDIRLDLQGKTLAPTEGALAGENRKVRLFISRASIWVEEIAPTNP